ncbi:MAG TPA: dienelactone hydrolase family protein [Vicinamibacterales bacterium]|nr:dienelactone hydrolase family protein [Vicinamibacterales bacterium]
MTRFEPLEATAVRVPVGGVELDADLAITPACEGIVLFAHGSGSSRHSPRNKFVAHILERRGFATLLVDLLTSDEEQVDRATAALRFDISMLAQRLTGVVDWLREQRETARLRVGLFGASTGAAAALITAADRPHSIAAVVSRGGRPDLGGHALARVTAPTLLIVGSLDTTVLQMNRAAMAQMRGPAALEIVEGATHLFEEPGALSEVAELAADWFETHLRLP